MTLMAESDDRVGFMLLHVKTFVAAALNLRENVLKKKEQGQLFNSFTENVPFFLVNVHLTVRAFVLI